MGAGAEGEARVQQQVGSVRVWRLVPAGHNPQAFTELQRVEVVHPGPLPVFVFHQGNVNVSQRLLGLLVPGVANVRQ